MELFSRLLLAAVFGLVLVGCTGTGGPIASETTLPTPSTSEAEAGVTATVADEPAVTEPPVTLPSTTEESSTTSPADTSTSSSTSSSAPPTSAEEPARIFEPGDVGAFTSPSGNIACVMAAETGVSCYISEKSWTIDQPDDPFCAESDWGNAVDVTADGVHFPCYTDFYWNPTAEVLAYGDRMEVGSFSCISRESGVTCDNGANGFEVARAAVKVLTF